MRDAPDLVSVVVPARNAASTLSDQLDALEKQDYEGAWEVVVVDNGSTDATAEIARHRCSDALDLRLVSANEGQGISYARNVGVRHTYGALIAFCDADDVVDSSWVSRMAGAATSADIIGGRLDVTMNHPRHRAWYDPYPEDQLPTKGGSPPLVVGCNFAVWRDVFTDLGGFDEGYRGTGEEIDFCWRAHLRGYHAGFAPGAVVHYRYRTDLRSLGRQFYKAGIGEAQLNQLFGGVVVPKRTRRDAASSVRHLLRATPGLLRRRELRGRWVARTSRQLGMVAGRLQLLLPEGRRWLDDRKP